MNHIHRGNKRWPESIRPKHSTEELLQNPGSGRKSGRKTAPAGPLRRPSGAPVSAEAQRGSDATASSPLQHHRANNDTRRFFTAPEGRGLEPGEPMAEARVATAHQELVADELATQDDEAGRLSGQARAVLLAAAGGGASEPAAVQRHAAPDLGAATAGRVVLPGRGSTALGSKRVSPRAASPGAPFRPLNHCLRADGRALEPAAGGDGQGSARKDVVFGAARNGNPGQVARNAG